MEIEKIISLLSQATIKGYSYLAGISAVIGAILPLTTIIFAQFYDKSAERSNELFWELREKLAKNLISRDEISSEFKKMLYIGGNSLIFTWTLLLFRWVSYILFLLWVMVCIGYVLIEDPKEPITMTDKITVIASTTLLSLILLLFPSIFAYVRKRVPISIKKNGFSITSIDKILLDDKRINKDIFYKVFLNPMISMSSNDSTFSINYLQNIPLNNFKVLWVLKTSDNKILNIKLNIDQLNINNTELLAFKVSEKGRNNNKKQLLGFRGFFKKRKKITNPTSLIKIFSQIDHNKSKVYFQNHKGDTLFTAQLSQNEEMEYIIYREIHSSINGDIETLLSMKPNFMQYYDGKRVLFYELDLL